MLGGCTMFLGAVRHHKGEVRWGPRVRVRETWVSRIEARPKRTLDGEHAVVGGRSPGGSSSCCRGLRGRHSARGRVAPATPTRPDRTNAAFSVRTAQELMLLLFPTSNTMIRSRMARLYPHPSTHTPPHTHSLEAGVVRSGRRGPPLGRTDQFQVRLPVLHLENTDKTNAHATLRRNRAEM